MTTNDKLLIARKLLDELQRQSREERDAKPDKKAGMSKGRKAHWCKINVEQLASVAIEALSNKESDNA